LLESHLDGLRLVGELGLFVKMDIEGAEYDVAPLLAEYATYLNGFVVEFHDLQNRWNDFVASMLALSERFAVCHVHGNNYSGISDRGVPETLEVSMINRALLPAKVEVSK